MTDRVKVRSLEELKAIPECRLFIDGFVDLVGQHVRERKMEMKLALECSIALVELMIRTHPDYKVP